MGRGTERESENGRGGGGVWCGNNKRASRQRVPGGGRGVGVDYQERAPLGVER